MLARAMPPDVTTVRALCERVLLHGDLASKLTAAPLDLPDLAAGPARAVDRPARDAGLD